MPKMFCEGTLRSDVPLKETLQRLEEEEDVILGVITTVESRKRMKWRGPTSVNSLELQDPWHANIQVNGKKINFKVDTRATAKRLTLEWTPEPMSQSSKADTSLRTHHSS